MRCPSLCLSLILQSALNLFLSFLLINSVLSFNLFFSFLLILILSYLAKLLLSHLSSVQLLSCVRLFAIPWTAALHALSITNSQSLFRLRSIESVMPSNHLILCRTFFLPSIFPSISVFPNESALRIRWPKYWNFSFSISPSNEYSGLDFL